MKKYKLIKEYPGSDHEGITVSLKTPNGLYEGYQYNYSTKHVENSPEYWEEVVERDYQIISYVAKDNPNNITIKRRGAHLHEEYWKIHSVKRLSDGEVFTIGNKITGYHEDARSIQTIRICTYTGRIRLEQSGGYTDLMNATKVKQPIFLTHDGKDIFKGDTVWYVNKESLNLDHFRTHVNVTFRSDINAYFLTEEEVKKYIIENKPALSINEFWEITWMSTSSFNKHTYMKNLVKQRLNLK